VVTTQLDLRLEAREALDRCREEVAKRRRREEHIKALLRELAHRSKNLLAVVLAIARQTAARDQSKQAYAADLCARVQGLAYTHDLVAEDDWRGAGLADLAMRQLGPFLDPDTPRVELVGQPLTLTPVAAQNIGLALHELAINAVKYGSLGGTQGHVSLKWEVVGGPEAPTLVRATWQEHGGPAPKSSSFKGFGRMVLDRIVPEALGGHAQLDLAPEGARWTLEIPVIHIRSL
jgi:two-component sensor histidine kinase